MLNVGSWIIHFSLLETRTFKSHWNSYHNLNYYTSTLIIDACVLFVFFTLMSFFFLSLAHIFHFFLRSAIGSGIQVLFLHGQWNPKLEKMNNCTSQLKPKEQTTIQQASSVFGVCHLVVLYLELYNVFIHIHKSTTEIDVAFVCRTVLADVVVVCNLLFRHVMVLFYCGIWIDQRYLVWCWQWSTEKLETRLYCTIKTFEAKKNPHHTLISDAKTGVFHLLTPAVRSLLGK